MISLIGSRPAIQVGRYQVIHYDTSWLSVALRRAASAAERHDFPFVDEIRLGIEQYLETKCPLQLLPLQDLFERMRHMLVRIGCESIAEKLEPLAPPVTLSLVRFANEAGNGFELAFFGRLRNELAHLHESGAEEIRFTGLSDAALALSGSEKWDHRCDQILIEIRSFLGNLDRENRPFHRPLRLRVDNER
ncbi:hypothetical protein [Luteolibacter marinus]|uniref:hypothetical protein n=1 Tax=Luteolibacter marinus TaxID=2776705 RepID=UPI0018661814|nr:hypothetical protein [Luteolibacter marinus]